MSAGSLTMACVLLVSGQVPADVWPTNQRNLKVPIDIEPARRHEIRELLLYCSDDQGRNWHEVDKVKPDARFFTFRAAADGLYYFRTAAINLQNKQDPENLFEGPPQQKILIDTRKPELRILSARRDGEFLVVSWEGRDENADPNSLTLEYQTLDGSPPSWTPVQLPHTPTGEARARLTSPAPVAVRMQLKDVAGNGTIAEAKVAGSGGVATAGFTGSPPNTGGLPLPGPASVAVPVAKPSADVLPTPPPHPVPEPVAPVNVPPVQPSSVQATPSNEGMRLPSTPSPVETGYQHVARATPVRPQDLGPPTNPAPAPAAPARRPLPPPQLVNDRTIVVEYELSRVGPSGIGSVELYLTTDGGQKWVQYAKEDEDKAKLATAGGKYQRTLDLPEGDGVYGLYLVVRNRAGRGKAPPRPGDAPEMLIEVDTTFPQAQLNYPPAADPERRDALLLTWRATDRNLGKGPICLDWAERHEGPWHSIAAKLPNTGKYSWQVPPGVPVEVYLRMKVRDDAGNEAVAITEQPQIVDLTEPEGKLNAVHPVGRP